MLTVKQVRSIMRKHGRGGKGHLEGIFVNKTVEAGVSTVKCYYTYDATSAALLGELRAAGANVRLLERPDCVGTISVRAMQ